MDGTGEHHLGEVTQVQKAKEHIILSYVEYRPNLNANNIIKKKLVMLREGHI
jgi:hypothetical protein